MELRVFAFLLIQVFGLSAATAPTICGVARNPIMIINAGETLSLTCFGQTAQLSWNWPHYKGEEASSSMGLRWDEECPEDNVYSSSSYKQDLTIRNIQYHATGNFSCKDGENGISHVYVFVWDPDHPYVDSVPQTLSAVANETVIIPCRPTHPKVNVTVIGEHEDHVRNYNNQIGFEMKVDPHMGTEVDCNFKYPGTAPKTKIFQLDIISKTPRISLESQDGVELGGRARLRCSVNVTEKDVSNIRFTWKVPNSSRSLSSTKNADGVQEKGQLINRIDLENLKKEDEGEYICEAHDLNNTKSFSVQYNIRLNRRHLNIEFKNDTVVVNTGDDAQWKGNLSGYPKPMLSCKTAEGEEADGRVEIQQDKITFKKVTPEDAGQYVCVVDNGIRKEVNLTLKVNYAPRVRLDGNNERFERLGALVKILCAVTSYPESRIIWLWKNDDNEPLLTIADGHKLTKFNDTHMESIFETRFDSSGNLTCEASNSIGEDSYTVIVKVSDVERSPVLKGTSNIAEGENATITCSINKHVFSEPLQWFDGKGTDLKNSTFVNVTHGYNSAHSTIVVGNLKRGDHTFSCSFFTVLSTKRTRRSQIFSVHVSSGSLLNMQKITTLLLIHLAYFML